ncbi:MAG TPA: MFS transporter [Dehalococcoidia bacterium]|nr:MFS transporter [Dehalococcoidia bacterium]
MPESEASTTEHHLFLSAWHYPQYRLLFLSSLGTYIGRWMETVVGAWLVLELTDSPFMVGLLGTCRFVSMLLGPFCGAIADRFSRRQILITVQAVYALGALTIMALFLTSSLEVWHLFLFTLVGGVSYTFDYSTRHAAAADIVKRQHVVAAISLLFVSQGSTTILGPLLGGSLLEVIGASGCFALIAGSFCLSFLALLPMKIESLPGPVARESIWRNLMAGFHYIRKDRSLSALILIAALVNLFVFPYWFTLIPVFARDVLHTEVTGYGQLMAAIGLGNTLGPLLVAILPDSINRGRLLVIVTIAWPAILMIFAFSRLFSLSLFLLVMTGLNQGMSMALIQSLLMMWSVEEMRGRISGARAFAVGTLPLGNLLTGAGASFWGAPAMLLVNSAAAIIIAIIIIGWASVLLRRR